MKVMKTPLKKVRYSSYQKNIFRVDESAPPKHHQVALMNKLKSRRWRKPNRPKRKKSKVQGGHERVKQKQCFFKHKRVCEKKKTIE